MDFFWRHNLFILPTVPFHSVSGNQGYRKQHQRMTGDNPPSGPTPAPHTPSARPWDQARSQPHVIHTHARAQRRAP